MMNFFEKLFEAVKDKTIIVTANKRLVVRIIHEWQKNVGEQSKQLRICSFDQYLEQCWQQVKASSATALTLLNVHQEHALWESILTQSNPSSLLQIPETAYLAEQAWQLCHEWQISSKELCMFQTEETQNFLNWMHIFIDQCRLNQWLDHARLLNEVLNQYEKGGLVVPSHVILVGFLELTPLKAHFFSRLQKLGCVIDFYPCSSVVSVEEGIYSSESGNLIPKRVYTACPDLESEIYMMARWARRVIRTHPNAFVICVVPNLHQIRKKIKRIFNEVFFEQNKPLFNLSIGESLIDQPLVYMAFEVLKFKMNQLSIQDISYLLRSPFIGEKMENFDRRALLDAKIRDLGNAYYTLADLIQTLSIMFENEDETFIDQLQKLRDISVEGKHLPGFWANVFLEELKALNWPGARTLNYDECQVVERFNKLLEEFSTLDLVQSSCSYVQAVSHLRQLAFRSVFQPDTEIVPVQILGLLEAIGQPSTHVWMMGADDQNFPCSAEPHPLLPFSLQRQLNMPHADADRELYFARLFVSQLVASQADTVFSYARCEHDRCLQPSALIRDFPQIELSEIPVCDFISQAEQLFHTRGLPILIEEAPSLQVGEMIEGGTDIIKQQAICPFRAFIKHRLHAKVLNEPKKGLSALEHGRLVHKVLEYFWKKVYSKQVLLTLSIDELESMVLDCIDKALHVVLLKRRLSKNFIQIERKCLQKLVMDWLLYERTRENNFEVFEQEKCLSIKMSELTINMRIDRIDRIGDGYALIDYKTGKMTIQSWFDDRPSEPQLLLYAISSSLPIQTIAFAEVCSDEIGFKGVSRQVGTLPHTKVLSHWQNQMERWQQVVEGLANDFCRGNASIDPKDSKRYCRNCEFKALCRRTWGQTPMGV